MSGYGAISEGRAETENVILHVYFFVLQKCTYDVEPLWIGSVAGEPMAEMHTRLSGEQRTTVWGALLIFLSIQAGYA